MIWNTARVIIKNKKGDIKFDSPLRTDYSIFNSLMKGLGGNTSFVKDPTLEPVGLKSNEMKEIKLLLTANPELKITLVFAEHERIYETEFQNYKDLKSFLPNTINAIESKVITLDCEKSEKQKRIKQLNQDLKTILSKPKNCNLEGMQNADFVIIPIRVETAKKHVRFADDIPSTAQAIGRN